ncbi:MAG: ROK family protein [Sphaerobacter sp.]|nr:ROK family protein [Sphaerobacter sp.]
MSDAALAVDLGGTNIRAALVTRDGTIRHLVTCATLAQEGPEAVIHRIVAAVSEVVAQERPDPSVPLGISAPGPLNPTTGVVYFATNLPGWYDIPLRDLLSERLQRPVMIGNDGNNAALGEVLFGVAKGVRHLIYLALGTGVGGGIIAHGQLIEGTRGVGGEVGHVSIDPSGPRCHCGGIGCIEAYASGWAIARDGELLVHSERSTTIRELAAGGPITAAIVAEAARRGDASARAVFERAGRALGVGLAGFVNLFNPEMIAIGGGVAAAADLLLPALLETLPRYTMAQIYPDVTVQLSALGGHTGIFGAAARVFYAEDGALGTART